MSADLDNFEIEHIDDEDFESRHIASEAMIRAPWRFSIASVSSRFVRSDLVALMFEGATHAATVVGPGCTAGEGGGWAAKAAGSLRVPSHKCSCRCPLRGCVGVASGVIVAGTSSHARMVSFLECMYVL